MTLSDFSNEFDILYNNIMSNSAPGLDEYEKSVLLTQAQEAIVHDLYRGVNIYREGFEGNEDLRESLSNLIVTEKLTPIEDDSFEHIEDGSQFFRTDPSLMYITFESSDTNKNKRIMTIPVTQDEYHRVRKNPFRRFSSNRVLRLDHADNIIELVSKDPVVSYTVKYIKRPTPIILKDVPADLSIEGYSGTPEGMECKLNPIIHRAILDRAVQVARSLYS